jgi:hypothetical protein
MFDQSSFQPGLDGNFSQAPPIMFVGGGSLDGGSMPPPPTGTWKFTPDSVPGNGGIYGPTPGGTWNFYPNGEAPPPVPVDPGGQFIGPPAPPFLAPASSLDGPGFDQNAFNAALLSPSEMGFLGGYDPFNTPPGGMPLAAAGLEFNGGYSAAEIYSLNDEYL